MPERLKLTQNTQFYVPINELDDSIVESILGSAVSNMESDSEFVLDEFRKVRTVADENLTYTYSVRVFPSVRPVYFIDEELEDRVYAFVLLIEYDGYIAIFKKSCANIKDPLEEHFAVVDNAKLTSTFDDGEVEFQKLSTRNMTVSDRALRARTYEAADLKGLLSTHSAGRSIPLHLRIRQGTTLRTISIASGRVVESSQRKPIDDIACWVKYQIALINNPKTNNTFLDAFARRVELTEVLNSSVPSAILIESGPLYERIERDGLIIKYKSSQNKSIKISSRVKNRLFSGLEHVYELDENGDVIGQEGLSRIRHNEKSLTLTSRILKQFRVVENGEELTLQKFIVKNGLYSISFRDPKYMYFMGSCFEDASGISEINSILEIFHPIEAISRVTSEKGNISYASTNFEYDSMFRVVEELHHGDDYVFCDDLGNEWADHITLNKEDSYISFIHSKHGSESTSASNLHDVVGQGIKNLGNMHFTREQFLKKVREKFASTYKSSGFNTVIKRVRKGDISTIESYLETLLADYKLHRKCILSCSFLSKSAVTRELAKIQRRERVSGHVVQLLWIISSFAHAVRDMNAIPIIYCKE